jgi:quinolinate synthase
MPGSIDQPDYQAGERDAVIAEIKALLKKKDAVLVAH